MSISFRESRTLRLIASADTGFFEAEDEVLVFVSSFRWTPKRIEMTKSADQESVTTKY